MKKLEGTHEKRLFLEKNRVVPEEQKWYVWESTQSSQLGPSWSLNGKGNYETSLKTWKKSDIMYDSSYGKIIISEKFYTALRECGPEEKIDVKAITIKDPLKTTKGYYILNPSRPGVKFIAKKRGSRILKLQMGKCDTKQPMVAWLKNYELVTVIRGDIALKLQPFNRECLFLPADGWCDDYL